MSDDIQRAEQVAGDAGWPMPSVDTQRLLQPVPVWAPSGGDEGEPRAADPRIES